MNEKRYLRARKPGFLSTADSIVKSWRAQEVNCLIIDSIHVLFIRSECTEAVWVPSLTLHLMLSTMITVQDVY